ncbi:hypothetical protein C8R43DRAFT_942574 [Mycena crocata]|nr:hypothetical protein C8R43DRAFT_942574 [Mycena crocata]
MTVIQIEDWVASKLQAFEIKGVTCRRSLITQRKQRTKEKKEQECFQLGLKLSEKPTNTAIFGTRSSLRDRHFNLQNELVPRLLNLGGSIDCPNCGVQPAENPGLLKEEQNIFKDPGRPGTTHIACDIPLFASSTYNSAVYEKPGDKTLVWSVRNLDPSYYGIYTDGELKDIIIQSFANAVVRCHFGVEEAKRYLWMTCEKTHRLCQERNDSADVSIKDDTKNCAKPKKVPEKPPFVCERPTDDYHWTTDKEEAKARDRLEAEYEEDLLCQWTPPKYQIQSYVEAATESEQTPIAKSKQKRRKLRRASHPS